jgi:hypothetical protein
VKISFFVKRYVSGENYEHDYSIWSVYNEALEVFQASSFENFKEELNDVSFTFQSWLHLRAKFLDWEMFWQNRSIKKMEDRLQWWSNHFSKYNLSFHPKYWKFGSNYKKDYKVNLGTTIAMKEQGYKAVKNTIGSVFDIAIDTAGDVLDSAEKKFEKAKDILQLQKQNVHLFVANSPRITRVKDEAKKSFNSLYDKTRRYFKFALY